MKRDNRLPQVLARFLPVALNISLTGCGGGSSASPPPPPLPAGLGGSNYLTHHLDPPCNREPYGVVVLADQG